MSVNRGGEKRGGEGETIKEGRGNSVECQGEQDVGDQRRRGREGIEKEEGENRGGDRV